MELKERIEKWIEIKKIPSVNELAARSLLTQSTLGNIMSGRNKSANATTIEKICDGLGVSITEFWELEQKPDIVSIGIAEAEKMPKNDKEKAALELLKAMPIEEQQRRILDKYNSLSPEQQQSIDVILRSLTQSR